MSNRFSNEERDHIYTAGRKWNTLVGREVIRFNGSSATSACGINRLNTTEEYERLKSREVHRDFAGVYISDYGAIYIRMDSPREMAEFQSIVMHELGHSLGLDHVEHGIMSSPCQGTEFTEDDRNECIEKGVCSPASPLPVSPMSSGEGPSYPDRLEPWPPIRDSFQPP